jgi:hypothetical protein
VKKIVFCIGLIFGILIALTSCATKFTVKDDGSYSYSDGIFALGMGSSYKYNFDENIPIEQSVLVTFLKGPSFVVTHFNDIFIRNYIYGSKNPSSKDETVLTIPTGNNKLTFNVSFLVGNTINTFRNIEIQYNLEPGKKYQIKGETISQGFFKNPHMVLKLLEVTNGSVVLREWNLSESIKK